MRSLLWWVVAGCVFAVSVAGWVRSGPRLPPIPAQLSLGALPPKLWVTDADDQRFELGALRGIPTVLLFFRGAG